MSILPTKQLPFDLPDLIGRGNLGMGHWFPAQPVAIQNIRPDWWRNEYLNPLGEGGKFAYCGGYARDVPVQPPAYPAGVDWQLETSKFDVQNAVAAGVDGFWVNLMVMEPQSHSGPQLWANRKIFQAATAVHPRFKVGIMLDMNSGWVTSLTRAQQAAYIASLAQYPSCYKIGSRVVISTFGADRTDPAFFRQLFDVLWTNHQIKVRFFPTFLNVEANMDRYLGFPEVDVVGDWGDANPNWNDPSPTGLRRRRILAAQERGWDFMMPINVQDQRPREGIFDESMNLENLRRTWQIAREGGSRIVQYRTHNDYAEGAQFAPSMAHAYALARVNAYFTYWWKTGLQPRIVRDGIYLTHRLHPIEAQATWRPDLYTKKMTLRPGSTPAINRVEAYVMLKADGVVRVRSGSNINELPVKAQTPTPIHVGLGVGQQSVELIRNSTTVLTLISDKQVVARPEIQDCGYWARELVA